MKEIKKVIQSSNPKNPYSDNMQGWEIKKLLDVVDFQRGLTYSKNDEVDFSDNIVLRSNNVDLKTNKLDFTELKYINPKIVIPENKKVTKGSLIICTANGSKSHLGKVALIDDDYDYAFGGFMGLIKPKENLNSDFLFYLMTSETYKKFIGALSDGANINNLKFGDLGEFEIPLPPLPEQQRIVSILDECFSAIERSRNNAEQNLKNTKEVFESYLQGVFGGSTGSPTKRDGWEEKRLGELATFRNGMNFTKSSKGEKINIVGVKDFQNSFWVPFETLETVTLEGNLNDLDLLQEGDIIVVRSNGNPQLIGRTLLASEVNGKVSHSGFTIRIRLNTKNIDPIYLCNYLKISSTRRILVDRGNGVGIKSLNQGSLSTLIIPYPKTLKEQQTIVRQLDALRAETQKLEAVYQKKLDDLEELKKSVLQKAFAGEL